MDMAEPLRRSDRDRTPEGARGHRYRRTVAGEPAGEGLGGNAIAKAMGLDPRDKANRAKVAGLLKTWIEKGMFVVVDGEDAKRMPRKFIEVGVPADSNLLQPQ